MGLEEVLFEELMDCGFNTELLKESIDIGLSLREIGKTDRKAQHAYNEGDFKNEMYYKLVAAMANRKRKEWEWAGKRFEWAANAARKLEIYIIAGIAYEFSGNMFITESRCTHTVFNKNIMKNAAAYRYCNAGGAYVKAGVVMRGKKLIEKTKNIFLEIGFSTKGLDKRMSDVLAERYGMTVIV